MTRVRPGKLFAVCLVAVLALALAPGVAHADRTIGITTAKFDYSVAAGQAVKGELYVTNDGSEPLTAMVYAANQSVDEKGEVVYSVPGRDDKGSLSSAASWLNLRLPAATKTIGNTPYLEIKPGERVLVKFDVAVPAQAPPGDHQVLLFFEMFDVEQALSGTGSVVGGRIGARIHVRVQGELIEKMEVAPFSVPSFVVGDGARYAFRIRNEGNIDKLVTANLAVLDGSENEITSSAVVTDTVVYAGNELERTGMLATKGLLGRRTVRLTVDYGAEATDGVKAATGIVKDRTVWFVPWWLLVVLAALIGAGAVWASWLQAVKAAEKRAARRREERNAHRPVGAAHDDPTRDLYLSHHPEEAPPETGDTE